MGGIARLGVDEETLLDEAHFAFGASVISLNVNDGIAHLEGPGVHDVLDGEALDDGTIDDGGICEVLPEGVLVGIAVGIAVQVVADACMQSDVSFLIKYF